MSDRVQRDVLPLRNRHEHSERSFLADVQRPRHHGPRLVEDSGGVPSCEQALDLGSQFQYPCVAHQRSRFRGERSSLDRLDPIANGRRRGLYSGNSVLTRDG